MRDEMLSHKKKSTPTQESIERTHAAHKPSTNSPRQQRRPPTQMERVVFDRLGYERAKAYFEQQASQGTETGNLFGFTRVKAPKMYHYYIPEGEALRRSSSTNPWAHFALPGGPFRLSEMTEPAADAPVGRDAPLRFPATAHPLPIAFVRSSPAPDHPTQTSPVRDDPTPSSAATHSPLVTFDWPSDNMQRVAEPDTTPLVHGGARLSAVQGDVVFVEVGEQRALAVVSSFDGTRYVVRPRVPRSLPAAEDGAVALALAPSGADSGADNTADSGAVVWSNAPLPTCCVCIGDGAEADHVAVLACRCSAPSVCAGCARVIFDCPQCRARIGGPFLRPLALARLEEPLGSRNNTAVALNLVMVSLAGKRYPLTAWTSWSVRTLKALYAHVAGVRAEQQTLKYAGRTMSDDRDLASYGLADGDVVHVVLNLGGD